MRDMAAPFTKLRPSRTMDPSLDNRLWTLRQMMPRELWLPVCSPLNIGSISLFLGALTAGIEHLSIFDPSIWRVSKRGALA